MALKSDWILYDTDLAVNSHVNSESRRRDRVLTCELPNLIRHRKVPILDPSIRKENDVETDTTHDNEKPKHCPVISRK